MWKGGMGSGCGCKAPELKGFWDMPWLWAGGSFSVPAVPMETQLPLPQGSHTQVSCQHAWYFCSN